MRILITGSQGFIGKNLCLRLREQMTSDTQSDAQSPAFVLTEFTRGMPLEQLPALVQQADAVVHLAGENRPKDAQDFVRNNAELTSALCAALQDSGRPIPLLLASSSQAELDNPYGASKRAAEAAVQAWQAKTGGAAYIYRLPGVFGKWCRPNYNSVVATFCHNVAHGLPLHINNPQTLLRLVYVDDVVDSILHTLAQPRPGLHWPVPAPEYSITLGDLAAQIEAFQQCRSSLLLERVGLGLPRALYATYVSYLPLEKFAYDLPSHGDPRGVFVEMLKTPDAGQFSFFTAHPGVTRGGHYHHSKTEKFLVIKGQARFGFRHMLTGQMHEITTSGTKPQVVETVPGWTHDITNIGAEEMVVMLWANENFDRQRPDTIASKVQVSS